MSDEKQNPRRCVLDGKPGWRFDVTFELPAENIIEIIDILMSPGHAAIRRGIKPLTSEEILGMPIEEFWQKAAEVLRGRALNQRYQDPPADPDNPAEGLEDATALFIARFPEMEMLKVVLESNKPPTPKLGLKDLQKLVSAVSRGAPEIASIYGSAKQAAQGVWPGLEPLPACPDPASEDE